MKRTLETAQSLQQLGWDIIPLLKKSPKLANWTELPKKPLTEIEKQLKLWRSENIGVRLGKHSRLQNGFFLGCIDGDIDTDDSLERREYGDAWREILTQFKIDPPTAITGSNPLARHVYVAVPEEISQVVLAKSKNFTKGDKPKPLWAITLYASSGRQMVLPPSIHPDTGRQYQWEKSPFRGAKLSPLPKKLLDLVQEKKSEPTISPTDFPVGWDQHQIPLDQLEVQISEKILTEIRDNQGLEDRSAGLLLAANALYHAGFSDAEVLSILTDPQNGISQVARDRRPASSRRSQAEWVWKYTCQKAKRHRVEEAFTPVATATVESDFIQGALKGTRRDKNGKLMTTIENVVTILANVCERKDWAAYDLFQRQEVYRTNTPWGGKEGQTFKDADDVKINYYLSKEFNFNPSFEVILRAIKYTCAEHRFHSGQEFLKSLKWDGKPRIDTWLKDYLGAITPAEPCLTEVSRKIMMAIVARQMEPGIKFDYVLLLKGGQGIGKSSAVDILNGQSAIGRIDPERPADSVLCMVGQRVVELAECWTLAKRESESVKAFFSAPADKIRAPYERRPDMYPRQSIFIGTTNRDDFLQDSTGERRYWVVEVTQCEFAALERDRDQLFAEALHRFELEREDLWLSEKAKEIMEGFHQEFKQVDAIEEAVAELLEDPTGNHPELFEAAKTGYLTLRAVIESLYGFTRVTDMRLERRVGEALRKLGFRKKVKKLNGKMNKYWEKI